ncbi:hypothetical protein KFL_000100510 [Klebsormidium nitens]|uniref:Glutathione S-transferase n=1 Tax=Klebsormidium nitens TaxID=105231 RepID=A0A1Y1HNU7_KLENI|nr:hypothetical protein KFL_000100510 [Klebsormidium nitens]|eukprot:GAQ78286.1 hypothetical protein KFL_000100510 [Klebsormidium nitens]
MTSCPLRPERIENLSPDELSECKREAKMGLQLHAHYLSASSRTVLTFLAANPEIKVDVVEKDFTKGELRTKEYREINPMGRLPFLIDGPEHFRLWGALPICLYLEEKFGPAELSAPLIPVALKPKAKVHEWSNWFYHTIGPKVGAYVDRVFIKPTVNGEPKPEDKELEELARGVNEAIAELEACFPDGQKWLVPAVPGVDQEVGSLADVRCAQKLVMLRPTPYDIEGAEFQELVISLRPTPYDIEGAEFQEKYPKVFRWLERIQADPAFQRANEKWTAFLEPLGFLDPARKKAGA